MRNSLETVVSASDFKARCLAILDRVARTGVPVVVTKRGKPVARVVPAVPAGASISLEGSVEYRADIVKPSGEEWEADR